MDSKLTLSDYLNNPSFRTKGIVNKSGATTEIEFTVSRSVNSQSISESGILILSSRHNNAVIGIKSLLTYT
jgi:hypothetical protein